MRITWLLQRTDQIWGAVKVALEDANWLAEAGHEVTVLSGSAPPDWLPLRCAFRTVPDFTPAQLPPADVTIAADWTTIAAAVQAGQGVAVHCCQSYAGDLPAADRGRIAAAYRTRGVHHLTTAPHLTSLLKHRFGIAAREIAPAIDHGVHFPGAGHPPRKPLRVGLAGTAQVPWQDLATGYAACKRAQDSGLELQVVRVSNIAIDAQERAQPFPVEWHERVPPAAMGDLLRSIDVFLGTASGEVDGVSLTALEAMACGVPCVLTEVPCYTDLGTDQYALFVPARDPHALAEALGLVGQVPSLRADLRARGLASTGRYAQQTRGRALERVLQEFAAAGGAPPRKHPAAPAPAAARADGRADGIEPLLRERAVQLRQRGDHAKAADCFAAAYFLLHDPALACEAASCRHLAGETERALRLLDELLRDGIDTPHVHEQRGVLLRQLGRAADAAQAYRAAIAAGARTADAYNQLGAALSATGDDDGARGCFERALTLAPGHEGAQANLAALLAG